MATVIYLPKQTGIGEAFGRAAGQYTGGKVREDRDKKRKEEKAKQLGDLFEGLTKGGTEGTAAAKGAITSGAITETGDLINLIGQLRRNNATGSIKVDAFTKTGKKTSFALNKDDLTTGAGEANANKIGLTLVNPGKQIDYFEDTPAQKYSGSSGSRITGKITLPEWKAKYATKKTATDKDTAISDYLKGTKDVNGVTLQDTAINRKRAREFLDKRGKAIEVINSAFGKRTGNDWTIEDPIKNQMAIVAKMQVEGFIVHEGQTAEQAGASAVQLAKEVYKDKLDVGGEPVKVEEESGGILTEIGKLFKGDKEATAKETRKSPNYIGDFNNTPIEIPDEITSPAAAMKHIMDTYKISKEDARQFLLDNAPIE